MNQITDITTVDFAGIVENPKKLMENAQALATAFNDIVEKQKLYTEINKKKHVHVDGWSMMGVLLGVFPATESTERVNVGMKFKATFVKRTFSKYGGGTYTKELWVLNSKVRKNDVIIEEKEFEEVTYNAFVSLNTTSGTRISKVEIVCSNKEDGKLENDEYSIQSMAQTRGAGKAFRLSFGWIARMAGYDSTPFEEAEGIYRSEPTKPHAPITVMNDIKAEIDKAKNEEEWRVACDDVDKYAKQLNDEDLKEIRDYAKNKKEEFVKVEPVKEKEEEKPSKNK